MTNGSNTGSIRVGSGLPWQVVTSGHRILSRVDFITQTVTSLLRILYKEQKEGGNTLKQYIRQGRLSHKSNMRLDIIRHKRATHDTGDPAALGFGGGS